MSVAVSVDDTGPVASNYSTATDEDTAISGGVLTGSVIAGEPGDSGDTLTYSGDSTSADGALVTAQCQRHLQLRSDQRLPRSRRWPAGATAIDTFSYTVTDNHGLTSHRDGERPPFRSTTPDRLPATTAPPPTKTPTISGGVLTGSVIDRRARRQRRSR